MKNRNLALLAALPAAILMANSAYAGVEVYGKLNVTVQQEQEENQATNDTLDQWDLESNASRFGLKASQDLGDTGLKSVAKIEYEVMVDDGTDAKNASGDELKQRNIYVGIQGGFGTTIAGNFDTPLKEAQGKVDLFNDLIYADITNVMQGENRMSNIIMYSTPKMESGIAAHFAAMPGEENDINCVPGNPATDVDADGECEDGLTDAMSASITWENDMFYVALAIDSAVKNTDTTRLVGQWKLGDLVLGGIIQQAEIAEGDTDNNGVDNVFLDEDAYMLSAAYTIGQTVLKAQYSVSENEDDLDSDDVEKDSISLGADYMLDKKSKVFAYMTNWHQEEGNVAAQDQDRDTFAVGYEYAF